MPLLFLAVLIGIPVLEIYTFIEVGGEIGALNTIILTILTAVLGMALLRHQGLSTLMRAQEKIQKGETPIKEVLSGFLLAIAGLFLLIPGFATDTVGFLLFLPPLRHFVAHWFSDKVQFMGPGDNGSAYYRRGNSTIIDGDFTVVPEEETEKQGQIDPSLESSGKSNKDSPWSKDD